MIAPKLTSKVLITLFSAVVATMSAAEQTPGANRFPAFAEYPASEIFKGKPSPPKLIRPADLLFRTKIREDAAIGPNFAGRLSIAEWGCGSSCVSIALVDEETGTVYPGPFGILGYGAALVYADVREKEYEPLSYNLNSRLLIVRGCPEDRNCASYFYEWTGSVLRLLRKIAAAPIPH
jgi:hypothetical protein